MQDHCEKSEKLKYFIVIFQSFITQLNVGRFSKSWVVLNVSRSGMHETGLTCGIWSTISHSTAKLLKCPVTRSVGVLCHDMRCKTNVRFIIPQTVRVSPASQDIKGAPTLPSCLSQSSAKDGSPSDISPLPHSPPYHGHRP